MNYFTKNTKFAFTVTQTTNPSVVILTHFPASHSEPIMYSGNAPLQEDLYKDEWSLVFSFILIAASVVSTTCNPLVFSYNSQSKLSLPKLLFKLLASVDFTTGWEC